MLTLSALKSEITADKNFNTLDSKSWEVKLHERAVDVKYDVAPGVISYRLKCIYDKLRIA